MTAQDENPAPAPPAASARPAPALAAALGEDFTLLGAVGGIRGLVESMVPVGAFSIVFAVTRQVPISALVAVVVAVLLLVLRIVRREPITPALSGLFAVAIGAGLAWATGQARGFFIPSLAKNGAFLLAYAISALVGWPLVGVVAGPLLGEGLSWRDVPARRRAYALATWLWAAMFAVRLGVMGPQFAHADTGGLAIAQFLLGLPLFGLTLLGTWLIVRRVPAAIPAPPTR